MKFSHPGLSPLVATLLALAAPLAMAQTTATTSPVGFITLNVAGASTTNPPATSALTLAGLGMFNPILFQGTVDVLAGNTITNNSASFTANQYNGTDNNCFIEFLTGANTGVILDVQSTGASPSTITTAQPIPANTAVGDTFCIRKHWTLASVFGATNQNGLTGGNSSNADQIYIYNTTTGGYDDYFYSNQGFTHGWEKNNQTVSDPASVVIYPDQGILISTQQSASESVVLMGAVKTGPTSIPVLAGLNSLGNVYAAGLTLGDSGLYTDGTGTTGVNPGNSSSADQVYIYNSTTGGYATYYYSNQGFSQGWVQNPSGNSATSVAIPVGASILIQRNGATGFNWVVPQHPTSFGN